MAKLIVDNCKTHKFDGVVLEVWQSLAKRIDDSFLYSLVKDIGEEHMVLFITPLNL